MQPEGEEDKQSPWEMFDVGASSEAARKEASSVDDDVIARCLDALYRMKELPRYEAFTKTPKPSAIYQSASGKLAVLS